MERVEALLSGFSDAPLGTATFVQRGTATPSTVYSEFEGTTANATGIVNLDSAGRVEVYVAELVDCTVKNSAGTTVFTFTVGNKSTNVEYIGASFTGTGYSGSPTAVNQPTTVKAILDLWATSSGSKDFKVSYNGADTNLSVVAGDVSKHVFNARRFGAVGDGVTDDTTAIQSAITACNTAGGLGVYFPAGTYLVSATLTNCRSLIGTYGTIVKTSSSFTGSYLFSFVSPVTLDTPAVVTSIEVNNEYAGGSAFEIFKSNGSDRIVLNQVHLEDGGSGTSRIGSFYEVFASGCHFDPGNANTSTAYLTASGVWLVDSYFLNADSGSTLVDASASAKIRGCTFTASGATSVTHVDVTGCTGGVSVIANSMVVGSGDVAIAIGAISSGTVFEEHHNYFGAGATPYSFTVTDSTYTKMGSRSMRGNLDTDNTATYDPPTKAFGVVFLVRSAAGGQDIRMDQATSLSHEGARATVIIQNDTGAGIAMTGSGFVGDSASKSFTIAANSFRTITFVRFATAWYVESVVTGDMT